MKRHVFAWYLLAGIFVLGPAGVRMYCWPKSKSPEIEPSRAEAGKVLFMHEWTVKDPLSPSGDGLGPVFNATSCVACHNQGGVGGGGSLENNVTTFLAQTVNNACVLQVKQGVVHKFAISPEFQETLFNVEPSMPKIAQPPLSALLSRDGNNVLGDVVIPPPAQVGAAAVQPVIIPHGVHLSQRNTPALFGAKRIDDLPDRVIIAQQRAQQLRWGMAKGESVPVGRALVLDSGRVGKFGWKAQSARLLDFVEAACANELGLGNPGQAQPASIAKAGYLVPGPDLTADQCQLMADFIGSLPAPVQKLPADEKERERVHEGQKLFTTIGCAECHVPSMGSIEGIYSDLLLHRMGRDLEGIGGYNSPPVDFSAAQNGAQPDEWRTPPLWGVADSAPYLHDGRAATLEDAIKLHGGQAAASSRRFQQLDGRERHNLVLFLKSLRAPS